MTARGEVTLPDPATLRRFDIPGPRYTSYPTADRFVEAFEVNSFAEALAARQTAIAAASLSLYVHLPFCATVCYYCGCNKVITKDQGKSAEYIGYLQREADLVGERMTGSRELEQLHFGGGTPTFLSNDELAQLMRLLTDRFPLAAEGEYSIEVDPRSTPPDKVAALAQLGFNRMSVGVQDFEPDVQKAVNRLQSFEMTQATVEAARKADFKSVNLDLIYGLPKQTRETFARTLDKVLVLSPERIALYHYAHLPDRFKPQRRIEPADLPSPEEKLNIMLDAIRRLSEAGYHYVGMDHFAKSGDDLARAQRQGRLHRNFQGYSTRPDCDLIGLGVSAISKVGPTYSQNVRTLEEYYDRLNRGMLPTARGIALDRDDILRRAVIMALMCHFEVALKQFEDEGLVENTPEWINVTPKGKLLVRAVAMTFDRYLRADQRARRYSKIV
ncbi:MAG: oxygen-independent coproporphyrinogen III oxidase [Burkholderiaceae bacterium]|nr:oxygen-independent coproporphyrinogen III oxidase [Burkholderiaceae bacterium]